MLAGWPKDGVRPCGDCEILLKNCSRVSRKAIVRQSPKPQTLKPGITFTKRVKHLQFMHYCRVTPGGDNKRWQSLVEDAQVVPIRSGVMYLAKPLLCKLNKLSFVPVRYLVPALHKSAIFHSQTAANSVDA